EDIPLLAETFLSNYYNQHGGTFKHLAPEVITQLNNYDWPGNIRELKNLMERLSIMCISELIRISDLPPYLRTGNQPTGDNHDNRQCDGLLESDSLAEACRKFEKLYITQKLQQNNWNISKTATLIGMTRRNLHRKINTLAITQTD
ncbi:MAG: sigma-54-dependent Fis family transcriptional regulator, partial [Deltaproteobacteria bacterium]|nr:sigma-54-dependent Fis family transcriptional regulator [Deltaproteobacteria bacterium]